MRLCHASRYSLRIPPHLFVTCDSILLVVCRVCLRRRRVSPSLARLLPRFCRCSSLATAVGVCNDFTTNNRKHTYNSIPRLFVCETELRPHTTATAAPPPPSKPPRQHHTITTAASQQQGQQRGGGDLSSPATAYVPGLKKKKKANGKTRPAKFKLNHFPKIRSYNGRPSFIVQLFPEPQNYEINCQK